MQGSFGRRLVLPFAAALAAGALVTTAPPAEAGPLPSGCWVIGGPTPAGPEVDLDGDGNPEARLPTPRASLCVAVDTGLYDPATFTCYGGLHECVLKITAGHTGSASVAAAVCVESYPEVPPLCTTADSGTIPLIPIGPHTTCFGWSPSHPPCFD